MKCVLIEGIGGSGIIPLLPADWTHLLLPGWLGPTLPVYSPEALADRMDSLLPAEDCLVVGVSLGGSVALAMRAPQVRRVVAIDPPLHPRHQLPLMDRINRQILPSRPDLEAFFATALDEYPIRTRAKAVAVVGSEQSASGLSMPTLCSAEDRSRLRAAGVQVIEALGAGHDVVKQAPQAVRTALQLTATTTT